MSDIKRIAFESYAKSKRSDLCLLYMYDNNGNYHYDGYIYDDTQKAYEMWVVSWKLATYLAEKDSNAG